MRYPGSLEGLEKSVKEKCCTPERVCTELAELFGVRRHEVALLHTQGCLLKFLFPTELRGVGCVPMSGYGVAARTAQSRKAGVFNDFVQVRHHRFFELIDLERNQGDVDPLVIHKMMSAPIVDARGTVLGVIQVSRKGFNGTDAGPDFTREDLDSLQSVARVIARAMPMQA